MIQNQTQLLDFLSAIKNETELAIDTEFRRVNTYYPLLCLLQIATKEATDCIDIMLIKNLRPLFEKLYQPNCLWIVHSARQDIEALYHLSKRLPKQLFDTQIAAALLGNPAQISYQTLTEVLQNIHLEKAYTRLNWTQRPLPQKAIEYALDDVRYLHKNYQQLCAQLEAENKIDWLQEEIQPLLNAKLYTLSIEQAWRKIKGLSRLNQKTQVLAAQLAAWREYQAQTKNKPRKWILTDNKLLALATGQEKFGSQIQQNFDHFVRQNKIQNLSPNVGKNQPLTQAEKVQKIKLQKIIQRQAKQYNLDDKMIANGKSLLQYIRGEHSPIFCQGWRWRLLQKELGKCKIV